MNHELAKELKDAGFPQKQHEISDRDTGAWPKDIAPYKWPYNPTLEELIEACGGDFKKQAFDLLRQYSQTGEWMAFGIKYVDGEVHSYGGDLFSTPTEAVARLWLALNKK